MSKRLYFNPSSDFSLSSPAVQHTTVIVCLRRLVWFPLLAETGGVFLQRVAHILKGDKMVRSRAEEGSEGLRGRCWGDTEDVDALCGNTA